MPDRYFICPWYLLFEELKVMQVKIMPGIKPQSQLFRSAGCRNIRPDRFYFIFREQPGISLGIELNYKESDDVLRVKATTAKAPSFTETFTIKIDKSGKVSLLWGDTETDFVVK